LQPVIHRLHQGGSHGWEGRFYDAPGADQDESRPGVLDFPVEEKKRFTAEKLMDAFARAKGESFTTDRKY
jgi:hypothetical protein